MSFYTKENYLSSFLEGINKPKHSKHKVFISYHHKNDQWAKEELLKINKIYEIFIDGSVQIGDIDESHSDEEIREIIRDEYLKDTTVTILLVGEETKNRKHIDWELYSSMHDGKINKKSGILVIQLPCLGKRYIRSGHGQEEKKHVFTNTKNWTSYTTRTKYEENYPYLPNRIIDCLANKKSLISIVNWEDIESEPEKLRYLIDITYRDKDKCEYDMSRRLRRNNS